MNIAGQTVLVTGASRGIGREIARQCAALGAAVIAIGRDAGRLEALATELGPKVTPWPADLTDPEAVDTLIEQLPVKHPGLSIVVNNAGVQTLTDFFASDPRAVRSATRDEIIVNLDTVVALSTGLLPHLRKQPSAAIVNITSGLAIAPKQAAPVYCATKAGVRVFTRALRYQCQVSAPHIQVVDAVMALVDTDMTSGRGTGKMSPTDAAAAVIAGMRRDQAEIYIGKTKILPVLMRLAPSLAYRILRNG